MESLDYDDIDLAEDPFKPITTLLDSSFQHKEEIELPERCQEIFHKKTSKHTWIEIKWCWKNQKLECRCAPAACWMASADASWHFTMDLPAGEIDVQWWVDDGKGQPNSHKDIWW